jgi:Carboxypeptidase regulatory-like domain
MPGRRPNVERFLVLAGALASFALGGFGQTFYGSILGTVTDPSGAPISGASVTVTNNGTGEHRTAQTSSSGDYQFLNLVPGNYKIDIENTGFKHYTRDNITVQVDLAARVDAVGEIGNLNQQIEVQAETPIIQTENASVGQVVQGRTVQAMPLNGRNVLNLVALVPGVVPQGGSMTNLTGQNVFSAGNYQLGGGTANQSSTLLDGVPVNVNYGNLIALVPDQDAVQEFRVQTNNNTAEYGMFTGGVINMTTKSGTNAFHGTAYEYLRNTDLNAGSFFGNQTGRGKPPFHQNQFGANIGGPIKKDKWFFFADYQGYRQRQAQLYLVTVPSVAMRTGDFSNYRNSSGAVIPIYDPLTTCGQLNNPACGARAVVTRAPFPGNAIPASRINPVSAKVVGYPYWGAPNIPGQPFTQNFNFSNFGTSGGNNDQYNLRGDQTISDKQRIFERYTNWRSTNAAANPYGNGLVTGDPVSPEAFVTNQAVFGDTYLFNPTTIADIRISYTRWDYKRTPGSLGIDESTVLGFPSYFEQIPALNGLSPSTTVPSFGLSSPTYSAGGTGRIISVNNNYVIAPTFTKIMGAHTLKFGADLRRLDWNYFQNNTPGGTFSFDNVFTSQNASSPGSTGNSFASFLLGYPASGNIQIAPQTASTIHYQGYYVNDSWQATQKLTITAGLRWEIPGVYTERYNRIATFNPTAVNPVLSGITVNGHPVLGEFDLVNTPQHPSRGLRNERYTNLAPRLGVAYRLAENTVIRVGAGIFYIPSDLQFPEGPPQAGINYVLNSIVSSINSEQTPLNTLANPFPQGLIGAPGRNSNYQQLLLGGTPNALYQTEPTGATYQWNFSIQHQFPKALAVEASYVGLHGAHLPMGLQVNQLPDQDLALGNALLQLVPNPFYGKVSNGSLTQPTVQYEQLLRPYPEYGNLNNVGSYVGTSNYNALQMKLEKRFSSGGTVLVSYTFSKIMTDAETLTSWLDSATGTAGVQDYNNLRVENSLSSFRLAQSTGN